MIVTREESAEETQRRAKGLGVLRKDLSQHIWTSYDGNG